MKTSIGKVLKKMEASKNGKIEAIERKYLDEKKKLLSKYFFCGEGEYNHHFDFKKNKIIEWSNGKSKKNSCCEDWVSKDNLAYVDVECFEQDTVSYDCGYGDCDEFAVFHVINHYEVCKKCGNMMLVETEEIMDKFGCPERSESWTKMDSDKEIEKIFLDFKNKMSDKLGISVSDSKDEILKFFNTAVDIKIRKRPYVERSKNRK